MAHVLCLNMHILKWLIMSYLAIIFILNYTIFDYRKKKLLILLLLFGLEFKLRSWIIAEP